MIASVMTIQRKLIMILLDINRLYVYPVLQAKLRTHCDSQHIC